MPEFNIENVKYFRPVDPDVEKFFKGESNQYVKNMGISLYNNALTETELAEKNTKKTFIKFKTQLVYGFVIYILKHMNEPETSLYFGLTAILCSLYRQGLTNAVDDNNVPCNNFFDLFHEIISLFNDYFDERFEDEIESMDENDSYYEIVKESREDFKRYYSDSTYKLVQWQNLLKSYEEIEQDC